MTDIIQCILSATSIVVAYLIPKRIMWQQKYENLLSEYRGYDYAAAVQGIVEFFTIDCKNDSNKIKDMYEKRFIKEIYGNDFLKKGKSNEEILKELKEQVSLTGKQTLSENNKTLHFQRRILAQFFCDLDICARSIFIGKKRVSKDFTCRESDIVKILILIGKAIEGSPILMKSISCSEIINSPIYYKGANRYLSHMYTILRKTKKYMDV